MVNQGFVAWTISSSLNPSFLGQPVTFTATAPSVAGNVSGSVWFYDNGGNTLGSAPISGNSASLSISTLSVGSHLITGAYSGDANHNGGWSGANLTQIVYSGRETSTNVASSLNPTIVGQPVTLTANISPIVAGPVSGTVAFFDGNNPLGTAAAVSNTASLSVGTFAFGAGAHLVNSP